MLNRVILQGRLTETPELKHTPNGNAVTVFSIAVEDSRSSGDERKVNFFKIEAWKETAGQTYGKDLHRQKRRC